VLGDCKDSARPICLANRCIQCTGNGDCKDPKRPICQAEQCRGCMADSECGPDPAVCLNHLDGRCATPDETIVVSNAAGCAMTATGPNAAIGTMTMPACSMQPLAQLVTMNRRVIVIRGTVQASSGPLPTIGGGPVSVVGQSTAVIAGGASPGLQITGADADVYVRSLALKSSTLAGIRATGGKVLLDGVVVDSNMGGGIFLDATSFTIANTTITNNGPAQEGATVWGGVYVSNVPATGPKLLQRVSIQNNKGPGLVCSAAVMGNGVLATGNSTLEIGSTCTVTSCASPSATCGAP
jgi:hypothetical protein